MHIYTWTKDRMGFFIIIYLIINLHDDFFCQTILPEPYLTGFFRLVFRIYCICLKTWLAAPIKFIVQMF